MFQQTVGHSYSEIRRNKPWVHADKRFSKRERLTDTGKDIKNKEEILPLLEALWLPRKVSTIHCKAHTK